jgi:putative redox protein
MTAKVVYTGGLRTQVTHTQSGTVIETDAPTDNHGKGERFSPTDLVAAALGTCIVTTMDIISKKDGIDLNGTVCDVVKVMVSDPRRIGGLQVHLTFPKDNTYTEDQKVKLAHIASHCPVARSLHPDCIQALTFNWNSTDNA